MATQKLQEIPAWAEPVWREATDQLREVGLEKLPPGMRQTTQIVLPDRREINTPTTCDRVDDLMKAAGDFIEVESLDYEDQTVRIRRSEVVAWFPAVHDDSIPEQRPVAMEQQPMPKGLDLSRLPTRR